MAASATDATDALIEIARAAPRDLRQQDVEALQLTLDTTLDHDLGLDSLTRVELFARIEQELRVRLPDSLSDTAETLRDIAAALAGASRAGTIAKRARPTQQAHCRCAPASIVTLDSIEADRRARAATRRNSHKRRVMLVTDSIPVRPAFSKWLTSQLSRHSLPVVSMSASGNPHRVQRNHSAAS